MKNVVLPLAAVSIGLCCCGSANAYVVLYTNGVSNSTQNATNITPTTNSANIVSDSFTVGSSTIDQIKFAAWTPLNNTVSLVGWSITPLPDGDFPLRSGIAAIASIQPDGDSTNPNFQTYAVSYDTFNTTSIQLGPGTYYLNLYNATYIGSGPALGSGPGDSVYWAYANSPTSSAFRNLSRPIPSEYFQVLGTVPEPSGVIPIVVAGLSLGLLAYRKRNSSPAKQS